MQLLVSGSLAFDRIMTFPGRFADHILPDKIHILNVCFLVNGLDERFGGTAGNIAYTLALLGEKPLVLSCVGKDFGPYEKWLKKQGLPTRGIRRVEEEFTAGAYITTDQSDNQITGFNPGAMKHPAMFDVSGCKVQETLAIVSPGNVSDMVDYPKRFRDLGIRYIFDPGQQITALSGPAMLDAITGSAMLVSNDYELELIMKATARTKAELLERTGAVITTLGEQGSLVCEGGKETRVRPAKARTVDPTGAGDAFRAGLIKGISLGRPLADAALMGSVAAAFAVEHKGTQEHFFSMVQFKERFEENFGPCDLAF